jgi:hypothetical protein
MCKVNFSLKECDRLDGFSDFIPWKIRLQIIMEEVDLWEHVENEIQEPNDLAQLDSHQKKEAKVKRIIIDFVKDNFISHILDKKTSKKMFDSLVKLFQNSYAS